MVDLEELPILELLQMALACNNYMYRIMEILHCDIYSSIEEALDISILQHTTLLLSAVCTGRHRVLFTSLPLVI